MCWKLTKLATCLAASFKVVLISSQNKRSWYSFPDRTGISCAAWISVSAHGPSELKANSIESLNVSNSSETSLMFPILVSANREVCECTSHYTSNAVTAKCSKIHYTELYIHIWLI